MIGSSSELSLIDKLSLYFPPKLKLKKAKLLLQYFKNVIDTEGNIISPSNTNKHVISILQDMLSQSNIDSDSLDLYIYLIRELNIPLKLIINKFIHRFYKTIGTGFSLKKNNQFPKKRKNTVQKNHNKWEIY